MGQTTRGELFIDGILIDLLHAILSRLQVLLELGGVILRGQGAQLSTELVYPLLPILYGVCELIGLLFLGGKLSFPNFYLGPEEFLGFELSELLVDSLSLLFVQTL